MELSHPSIKTKRRSEGQLLLELLLAMALSAIMLPALLVGLTASRSGKAQQQERLDATTFAKEAYDALRVVREQGWTYVKNDGRYYPVLNGNTWALATGSGTVNGFTRYLDISDVFRDINGNIATSGGTIDPSTKKITITVSWTTPYPSSISYVYYVVDTNNQIYTQSSFADFNAGTKTNVQVTNTSGGEVTISTNTKGKWCSPSVSSATITLPDGPPVAVAAYSDPNTTSNPNKVFVADAATAATSTKLAYLTVTANTDPPVPTFQGKFTLDSSKYSNSNLVPTGLNIDNSFITNKVTYYTSSGGKTYALLATTKPNAEVIAISIDNFQDPVNKIYKYWTYFDTRIYQGTGTSDQSPYSWGGSALTVLGNTGYVTSGGYLYAFNLSNIDSKSTSNGLDMVGCRIELDGYDCNPSTSKIRKYGSGQTGTNFGSESSGQTGCSDGGIVEKYADTDIYPVTVSGNTYIYVAVGAGVDPELDIANVTSVPTSGTSPTISNNSCGRISGGNSSWKMVGSLDFNSMANTQETANSVFGSADGTRAYMSSNGTVDANGDGKPDSDQFYIIDTSTKTSPKFLSGTPSTGAQSGYYLGTGANVQLFPRRSITVFGDSRALLAGIDGVNDSQDAYEYQVLDISNPSNPTYCGGVDFDSGYNDMTALTEADGDKFVYLIANTTSNELKIIQGGPDGNYLDSGTYESAVIDMGAAATFNRFYADANLPAQTSIQYQIAIAAPVSGSCTNASYVFIGPDGTSNTKFATGSAIPLAAGGNGFINPGECLKYRAYLSTTNYNTTPTLLDISFNYSL